MGRTPAAPLTPCPSLRLGGTLGGMRTETTLPDLVWVTAGRALRRWRGR